MLDGRKGRAEDHEISMEGMGYILQGVAVAFQTMDIYNNFTSSNLNTLANDILRIEGEDDKRERAMDTTNIAGYIEYFVTEAELRPAPCLIDDQNNPLMDILSHMPR